MGQSLLLPAAAQDLQVKTPAQTVEVTPGDTLSQIAATYGVELPDIMRANGIANPNSIAIGQELVIPPQAVLLEDGATRWSAGHARLRLLHRPSRRHAFRNRQGL